MPGRGKKDKHGPASHREGNRGSRASADNKYVSGGMPSIAEERRTDMDTDRNAGTRTESIRPPGVTVRNFNLVVDGVPYLVRAVPFTFNDELRFRVSINGNSEHVFTWDSQLGQLRAIDDNASVLPDSLEEAISARLQAKA